MDNKFSFDIPKKPFKTVSQPNFLLQSRMFVLLVTILVMTILLANKFIWKPIFEVNQLASMNIYSTKDFSYEDADATNRAIEEKISSISPSKSIDEIISDDEIDELNEMLVNILDVKMTVNDDIAFSPSIISSDAQKRIYSLSPTDWQKNIYEPAAEIIAKILSTRIPVNLTRGYILNLTNELLPKNLNELDKKSVRQIVLASFLPDKNLFYASKQVNTINENSKKQELINLYDKYKDKIVENNNKKGKYAYYSPQKKDEVDEVAIYVFNRLEEVRRIKKLNALVYNTIPLDIREAVKQLNYQELFEVKDLANYSFEMLLDEGIIETKPEIINERLNKFLPDNISEVQRKLIYSLVNKIVRPNYLIDKEKYEEIKKEVIKKVKPVMVNVDKGELLIEKGQLITENKLKLLSAAGLLDKKVNWVGVSDVFSLITLLMFMFVTYLYAFERDVASSPTYLWLLSSFLMGVTLIANLFENLNPKFIPLAVFAAIISMFINRRVAFVAISFIILLYSKFYDISLLDLITLFVGAFAALMIFPKVNQRINILKSGIIIALIQVITFNIFTIAFDVSSFNVELSSSTQIIQDSVIWLISGFIFSMVILALLPIVEESFGLVTYSRLTELGDFNQPLLRDLEEKAPGTFQHSIAVAALSEFAARKLNLDSTLTRVGSYYHDLGKMLKPEFFIENQIEKENPHDKINDPYQSAKVIISHARGGVSIARKHKLPQSIVPFILEHHGTNLVSYFYYRALQNAKNKEEVQEEHFRYFGPKPQSKETAIVMLADSSEAAVRSLKDKSRENVKDKVKDIVAGKINDGQLSESGLTTDEIALVIESFTEVIMDMYHNRIEYPSMKK